MRESVWSAHGVAATGIAAMLALFPLFACADALDSQLDCKSTGHDFISPLLVSGEVEAKPMRVEPNSVNAFRVKNGVHLTAFDYRVYAVIGYQKDDPLFQSGKGDPISDSAYGVVVFGPSDDVEDRLHQASSPASVHHVNALITAILCKQ